MTIVVVVADDDEVRCCCWLKLSRTRPIGKSCERKDDRRDISMLWTELSGCRREFVHPATFGAELFFPSFTSKFFDPIENQEKNTSAT